MRFMSVAVALGLVAFGTWAAHPADAPRALLGADAARAQAMVAGDLAALDRALGDDLSYGHSNGVLEDKGALLESIRSGSRRYRSLTPREASARLYGDTGIVVALADAEVDAQGQASGTSDVSDVLNVTRSALSFLMVGTLEPRKGHAQALSAFERLWASGLDVKLVLVGNRGWMVDDLTRRLQTHPERGKRLFWLEGIGDASLEEIYATATCLLAASEGE